MFLQPDGTLIVQLVNFAIFFALLSVLFLRPVSQAIRKRREYINGVSADYDTYQAEAKRLRAQAEEIRAHARRDAAAHIAKDRAEASNASAELAVQYAAQVQATVESAHRTVAGELAAAREQEAQIVAQLSDLMVERTVVEAAK
jgi:F0F1-type ATP synthase membrane subunit b/b'